jgi:hypothetical protein
VCVYIYVFVDIDRYVCMIMYLAVVL